MAQRLFKLPDKSYAFVSTSSTWADLGPTSSALMTATEAMERTGMADMRLVEAPLSATINNDDGSSSSYRMPKDKGILLTSERFDFTQPVGVTGKGRPLTQFGELIHPMDTLVDESGGYVETFGLLEPGGRWFGTVRLPEEVTIGGDVHYPYLWGVDGLWSHYTVAPRMERFICTNQFPGLIMAAKADRGVSSYVMRHSANAKPDIKLMRLAINATYKMAEELDVIAQIFLDQEFTSDQFHGLTDGLFGVPEEDPATGRVPPAARTNYRKRQRQLEDLFIGKPESTETTWRNGHPTKWTAFQAVSEYIDWVQPVKGDQRARRLERTMDRSIQNIKTKALEVLA